MRAVMELRINGERHSVAADGESTLLAYLRDTLHLTGTKYGCGEGECGACTVLVDGEPVRSCLARMAALDGKEITTIEGLARGGRLHPLQQAFLDDGALQCGYCTSGMIMAGVALLRENSKPTRAEIVDFMNGHICRCGTYQRIIAAITRAAAHAPEAER